MTSNKTEIAGGGKLRRITLERIELKNFKCHAELSLRLGGRNATISGDNAAGKTSVYDALCWLLFGKDSLGRGDKQLELKPLDASGQVRDRQAVTSVEACFHIDGEALTLRRSLREQWALKRGAQQAGFEGNVCDYAVDGVPVKKSAYERCIAERFGDAQVFRLLTSVHAFAGELDYRERRAIVLQMAGVAADTELLRLRSEFDPLRLALGEQSLETFSKKLAAQKKALSGVRDETPAKLAALRQVCADLEQTDFAAAQARREELDGRRAQCMQALSAPHDDARERECERLRLALSALETDCRAAKRELAQDRARRAAAQQALDEALSRAQALRRKRFQAKRCPACGQELPAQEAEKARLHFENTRTQALAEIERTAEAHRAALRSAQPQPPSADSERQREELAARLAEAQRECRLKAQQLEQARGAERAQLRELEGQIAECDALLGKRETLEAVRASMDTLRAKADEAAAQLERVERLRYLREEFLRFKVGFVEERINRLFRLASFRLFRAQANGGVEERCDVTYGGVPYAGLNSGARVQIGMDILATLCRHYGVCAPLFVDNAESVTHLPPYPGQLVRLAVSKRGGALRCETEAAP